MIFFKYFLYSIRVKYIKNVINLFNVENMLPFVLHSPPDNESYENMWECHSSMFCFARILVVLAVRNSNGICRVSELIHS